MSVKKTQAGSDEYAYRSVRWCLDPQQFGPHSHPIHRGILLAAKAKHWETKPSPGRTALHRSQGTGREKEREIARKRPHKKLEEEE